MRFRDWDDIPEFMKCEEIKEYYEIFNRKRHELIIKRFFDIVFSLVLLIILFFPMIIVAVLIKLDSSGPVFYRQERVTAYGEKFRIHKFRTMINDADKMGALVTVDNDIRITKVGNKLRSLRIDEIPQLIDVLMGKMSFVGTRPEVAKYVQQYTKEMYATLLLPAGITSEASIRFKDEADILSKNEDVDLIYVEEILPEKMKYNLQSLKRFSIAGELSIMFRTISAVLVGK